MSREVSYHDADFPHEELMPAGVLFEERLREERARKIGNEEAAQVEVLPVEPGNGSSEEAVSLPTGAWNQFHDMHAKGNFFKPKRYLAAEFPELISKLSRSQQATTESYSPAPLLLDAGCGNGASLAPFLNASGANFRVCAIDCSQSAVDIFRQTLSRHIVRGSAAVNEMPKNNVSVSEGNGHNDVLSNISSAVVDLASDSIPIEDATADAALLVFVLSAIPVDAQRRALLEIRRTLRPGSLLCFRDYGLYDMTHLRSTEENWVSGRTFLRGRERTLVTFFTLEVVRSLFESTGFEVQELKYATVEIRNRKSGETMRRCFVHGKMVVPAVTMPPRIAPSGALLPPQELPSGECSNFDAGEFDLRVGPSQIGPVAGSGLFVGKNVPAGAVICEYQGVPYATRDAMRLSDHSYLMRLGPQKYIDALTRLDVAARYINDCRHPLLYNVSFDKRPADDKALVVASRNIRAGEELFVDYGWKYWLSIKGKRLPPKIALQLLQQCDNATIL